MKLWYINIWLNPETGYDNGYRYKFTLHTRFISNYLSRQMRKKKHRFETDGTYNMISVEPYPIGLLKENNSVPEDIIIVKVPFDKRKYEQIKGTEDCEYYLKLLEMGFRKASKFKKIPLDTLLYLVNNFRKNNYKNEWQHKKKRFKELNIEVTLNCFFTTLDFKLVATINKISTKQKLCSGIIMRTEPNEIVFSKLFKDIFIDEENIIVKDSFGLPRISISLKKALNKKLSFELIGDEFLGEDWVKENLSYSL